MPHTNAPAESPTHSPDHDSALPEAFIQDMRRQLAGIKDVRMAYDLIAMLVDPRTWPNPRRADMGTDELGALMRILNKDFYSQLHSAEGLLERY